MVLGKLNACSLPNIEVRHLQNLPRPNPGIILDGLATRFDVESLVQVSHHFCETAVCDSFGWRLDVALGVFSVNPERQASLVLTQHTVADSVILNSSGDALRENKRKVSSHLRKQLPKRSGSILGAREAGLV